MGQLLVLVLAVGMSACESTVESTPPTPSTGATTAALESVIVLPPQQVTRRIYSSVALSKTDARLHILAGSAYFLGKANPSLSAAQLTAELNTLASALNAAPAGSTQNVRSPLVGRMIRILNAVEPTLSATSPAGVALREYARKLLGSMRVEMDQQRQLTSITPYVDRYIDAEAFIAQSWADLFDLCQSNVELASVVNDGSIGTTLAVRTTNTTQQMLTQYPIEPLRTTVLAHLQADGSLTMTMSDVRALATDVGQRTMDAANSYAQVVYDLNTAQQNHRNTHNLQSVTATARTTAENNLKTAIDTATARNAALDFTYKDWKAGASTLLTIGADLATLSGERTFASHLTKFRQAMELTFDALVTYADTAIKTAKMIGGLANLGATGVDIIATTLFTGNLVGVLFKVINLMSPSSGPQTDPVLLAQLRKIETLVTQIKNQMNVRFDVIDKKLNIIYAEMLRQFRQINWDTGELTGNVAELQEALFRIQSDLNRVDRNVYEYFDDINRDPFQLAVVTYLGWDARNPSYPMPYVGTYTDAEGTFFKWATDDSQQVIAAGSFSRATAEFEEDGVLEALTSREVAYNINYLNEFPARKMGLPLLWSSRLASPTYWTTGASAYAQLTEEQSAHAAVQQTRHPAIADVGTNLKSAFRNLRQKQLFSNLHQRYLAHWAKVKEQIGSAETTWKQNPSLNMSTLDLWNGPNQLPTSHFLAQEQDVPRCDGKPIVINGTIHNLRTNFARWNHDALRPFMVGHNLTHGQLGACHEAQWIFVRTERVVISEYNKIYATRYYYRLQVKIHLRYTYNDGTATKTENVYTHVFDPPVEESQVFQPDKPASWDPNTYFATDAYVVTNWNNGKIFSVAPFNTYLNDALRTRVSNEVTSLLYGKRREFYRHIAARTKQLGDGVNIAAGRLSGSKLLWESYVVLGLPATLESNEVVRGLLYGVDALPTGWDVYLLNDTNPLAEDQQLDDLEDIYWFFGTAAEPPQQNILVTLDGVLVERANRLKSAVDANIDRLVAAGEYEGDVWVDATLLRLRLSDPP